MFNTKYSPFSKSLDAIEGADLAVLREVDEGWFVDYKSQGIKPVDFGKILSSFANQFGGWIFIGVEEGPNKSLRADAFPGIPTAEVPKILVAVREGISAHVSNPILFQQKVIDGPTPSIGLPKERSIVILNVAEGENPPYVHSSGKIYRRIADSSEPKPETDRSVLDAMWRRSEKISERLKHWILDPVEAFSSEHTPVGYLYLLTDRGHSNYNAGLTFEEFRSIVTKPGAMLQLDQVLHTQDGYMARHLLNNDPSRELASLRWFLNGNVRITVPINPIKTGALQVLEPIHKELVEHLFAKNYGLEQVLDMGLWSLALMGLIRQYFQLTEHLEVRGGMAAKVLLKNVQGWTPYLPMEALRDQLKNGGVPSSADNLVVHPLGFTPDSFLDWEGYADSPIEDIDNRTRFLAFQVIVRTLRALGLGFKSVSLQDQSARILIEDFFSAMKITSK